MKKNYIILAAVVILLVGTLTGCMAGGGSYDDHTAGVFSGIWHGWIAPFSLVISIFNKNISIYEANNTGWWYDFGFYIAIISGFGGISFFRNKKKNK